MSELATVETVRRTTAKNALRPRAMTMVLEGELGRDDMAEIGELLVRLSMDGVTDLVMDFRGVTHVDYRGLSTLSRRAEVFRALGGDVKLAGLSAYLFTVLQAAGVQFDFDVFADVGDAQAAFRDPVAVRAV
ncbi:MAG: STAS domain-containing protein [Myxococcaceae bacterium]|jgi:anti-sigma B factor antagonist|nr:STAS domain-containing protein [Myxococcaceae bacterium]MCA3014281.1 STAS domain-containing protein [Myxococcaceae bacterium]